MCWISIGSSRGKPAVFPSEKLTQPMHLFYKSQRCLVVGLEGTVLSMYRLSKTIPSKTNISFPCMRLMQGTISKGSLTMGVPDIKTTLVLLESLISLKSLLAPAEPDMIILNKLCASSTTITESLILEGKLISS